METVIQVLFAFEPDDVLRSVAWVDGDTIMRRILIESGETFDQASGCRTLADVWRYEGLYMFFRPALVVDLPAAFSLLGSSVNVLDKFPRGPLKAPRHWSLDR